MNQTDPEGFLKCRSCLSDHSKRHSNICWREAWVTIAHKNLLCRQTLTVTLFVMITRWCLRGTGRKSCTEDSCIEFKNKRHKTFLTTLHILHAFLFMKLSHKKNFCLNLMFVLHRGLEGQKRSQQKRWFRNSNFCLFMPY